MFGTKEKRIKIANILFYIALAIELVLMIVEKSELNVPFESHVFRVTFLLTLFATILIPRDKWQWAAIAVVTILCFFSYEITGRNELLRFAVFVMAAKEINLEKTMKAMFIAMVTGFSAIALLSVLGILGKVQMLTDYGRDAGEEVRYVLGFGHPNTLWGCFFAVMLLWIWLYGKRAKVGEFIILALVNVGLYKITVSRTAFLIGMMTVVITLIVRYVPKVSEKKLPYVLSTVVTPVFCVAFSIWAAKESYISRYYRGTTYYNFVNKLDELLNNRMHNLYRSNYRHAGALETWKLFSDNVSSEYFDMGWVRLFYWYGIIPAALACILVAIMIYICYRKKDAWTLILILSLSIYTIVEATFVSVYIGRNFMLPIVGVYLGSFLERKKDVANS